jgi:hypothetical protein
MMIRARMSREPEAYRSPLLREEPAQTGLRRRRVYLLPIEEKCRSDSEAMRATTRHCINVTPPPHPTLRATFSPIGRRETGAEA